MASVIAQVYANVLNALKADGVLPEVSADGGFTDMASAKTYEDRGNSKSNWCELWELPGGYVHPFLAQQKIDCKSELGIRYGLCTRDQVRVLESKESVIAALIGLGQQLGVPGVTRWELVDSTDQPIASYPEHKGTQTETFLKITVYWQPAPPVTPSQGKLATEDTKGA